MIIAAGGTTVPAPARLTPDAFHLGTAWDPLCAHFALWAVLDVAVVFDPGFDFFVADVGAADARVGHCATLEADILTAVAGGCFLAFPGFSDVEHACYGRTPPKVRIHVNIYVFAEFYVLFKDLFRAKALDISAWELLVTSLLHTLYLWHFSFLNISLKIHLDTVLAKQVRSTRFQTEKLIPMVLLRTNLTLLRVFLILSRHLWSRLTN